jgi:GTP-binding protein Era
MICLLNKIDEHKQEEVQQRLEYWTAKEMFREVIPVSALNKFNIDILPSHLASYLPEGAAFYDEDQITDKSEKFIASEIIREKIMMRYKEEIPYSVQVEIESFKEEEQIIRISAIIYVMRETQRKILIGKGGIAIKQTGIAARRDLEQFFNKKIFLETYVKVKENWRDNEKLLKDWGYES